MEGFCMALLLQHYCFAWRKCPMLPTYMKLKGSEL